MEQEKNNKGVIVLLIVLVVILAVLCVLFATGTISFKSDANSNESSEIQGTNTVLTETEAQSILKEVIPKCFEYVHSLSPYCGKRDTNDYLSNENYIRWEASEFSNKSELVNYLKTFLSEDVINTYSREGKYVYDMYREENGKLYCLNSNKDCGLTYNSASTSYEVNNITENLISVTGKIGYDTCGGSEYYSVDIELSKNNDTWIVTKYVENN